MKKIKIADLFCGAGGTSEGAVQACVELGYEVELTAINHDETAIHTHLTNHPGARHLLTGLDRINPRELYQEGELNILWASPECTHHSSARGGRPIQEQSRSTAHCVTRWAEALRPGTIWVENVPEFLTWGPLDDHGRPIKERKGEMFQAWLSMLRATGYTVDWRILCAADHGDPTTRRRLFVQAVRDPAALRWPKPTHAALKDGTSQEELFLAQLEPWKSARDHVIDWSLKGQLLTERKRPLADKTMRRIIVGFFKQLEKKGFGPFVVPNFGERATQEPRSHDVDGPLPTVTSHGAGGLVEPEAFIVSAANTKSTGRGPGEWPIGEPLRTITTSGTFAMAQPILVRFQGDHAGKDDGAHRFQSVDLPIGTVTTENRYGIAEPLIVGMRGSDAAHINGAAKSVGQPLGAVTCKGTHHALVQPLIVGIDQQGREGQVKLDSEPLSTATTKARHAIAEPVLVQVAHGNGRDPNGTADDRRHRPVDAPLPAVCGNRGEWALLEPSLLPQHSAGALRPVSEPVPTVACAGAISLVQAYLVKFYGTGVDASVDQPLDTVTTKHRHGLVLPVLEIEGNRYLVNFRFRMLQPHELAAAQGFPSGYTFKGTKTQQVKQIGNAVPCNLAKALVKTTLSK